MVEGTIVAAIAIPTANAKTQKTTNTGVFLISLPPFYNKNPSPSFTANIAVKCG